MLFGTDMWTDGMKKELLHYLNHLVEYDFAYRFEPSSRYETRGGYCSVSDYISDNVPKNIYYNDKHYQNICRIKLETEFNVILEGTGNIVSLQIENIKKYIASIELQ